jgi:hypothetical protein
MTAQLPLPNSLERRMSLLCKIEIWCVLSYRVTRIKDTRITNAATFEVQREDHTLGNLIRM